MLDSVWKMLVDFCGRRMRNSESWGSVTVRSLSTFVQARNKLESIVLAQVITLPAMAKIYCCGWVAVLDIRY